MIDEVEAVIVREVFALYLEHDLRQVVRAPLWTEQRERWAAIQAI